ncbi:MAG: hypothetical protein P8X57_07290, partial [Cyclobacteriaceae bacterium]
MRYTVGDILILNINSSIALKLMVRIAAGRTGRSLEELGEAWKQVYGEDPFLVSFADDLIQAQYQSEQNLSTIVESATLISILIGSLGLFGLASLTMNARSKEVGIRKILGARQGQVIFQLNKSYLLLLALAILLAAPLTYLFVADWLNDFEYRINMSPAVY